MGHRIPEFDVKKEPYYLQYGSIFSVFYSYVSSAGAPFLPVGVVPKRLA